MATSESPKHSSSSSKPEMRGRYDIFLSFRGLDTRKKFTDHLYNALKNEGFQIFRDDDEIERSAHIKSELEKSIRNSRMSVIVLSKNYANSMACLFEVQTILELCKKSDHFVLPVFYEVDPFVVKEQAKNLDFREKEVPVEKMKGWSAALKEIASMAGMVFDHGYEAEFIEEIVDVLKSKLDAKHLRVGDHLINMNSRTHYVNSRLEHISTRVGILVIAGMGGIGKTTIAKEAYNSNHGEYDASCFLSNIREIAKAPNGLVRLQRQLISNILRKDEHKVGKVGNIDNGCRRMKYILANKRVLLVLDDVDQRDQVFALAGQPDSFMPGSKIIITTRDESVMAGEHCAVYRPKKLSIDDSLEVFSWHAFGQKHPSQDHMDLSRRFLHHCDGLPLALQVLGSSVRHKSLNVWKSALQKLEANSDNRILKRLEISYDSLKDDHDKNMFLEIACFFVGKKKKDTITILEGCGYSAIVGIHNLVNRNLLIIENEKLRMHPLLQDMGKQIVCRESKYPEKRSRIWCHMESYNILSEKIGTKKIEGLILYMNMLRDSNAGVFEANTFEKMHNLRLLKLSGVQFSGTYDAFPKRLGWLYWRGFPSKSFPNDFPTKNLVALDMRYSNLKCVWKESKVLGSLKILNLSHSRKLSKTLDFSRVPNLEKLILKDCPSLFEIDESFVKLQRIESLNLQDCKNLRKLPRNISMVESLVEMNISGCSSLKGAIEELEKMKSLRVLHASRMDKDCFLTMEVVQQGFVWPWAPKPMINMSLTSLPSSLTHLNLSHCNPAENAFPGDFSRISKLQHLFLVGNQFSNLTKALKYLTRLKTVDLSWFPKLQQIHFLSISFKKLILKHCPSLLEVDGSIGKSQRIESLNLQNCEHLRKLPKNINMAESLVEMNISDCSNLVRTIEEMKKMKSLQVLHASKMDKDRFLTIEVVQRGFVWPWTPKPMIKMSLASLASSLTQLNLSHCNLTEDAFPGDFSRISKLQHLFLVGNQFPNLPKALKDLRALQMLDISWCRNLQQILFPSISLEKLVVIECRASKKITFEISGSIERISGSISLDYIEGGLKIWSRKKRPIQILLEGNIYSTYFPGSKVPHWFSNRNPGSAVSFTMGSSSPQGGIYGLNLCLVYTLPDDLDWLPEPIEVEVSNNIRGLKMVHTPRSYGIPETGGDMVWLSHWLQGFPCEEGDEVQVVFGLKVDGQIKECGVHLLYFGEDEQFKYLSTIDHSWDSRTFDHSWDSRMVRVVEEEGRSNSRSSKRWRRGFQLASTGNWLVNLIKGVFWRT